MTDNQTKQKVQNKKYGNRKLSQCIEKMYLDSETADVHFEVVGGEGSVEHVPAHKSLLAAVSDVFKAMFYGQLKEEGDVKLTDVTAEALKEFLQFFYMREVEPTMKNIADVMYLANKYNIPMSLGVCGKFLSDTLTDDSICTGLEFALLYDQKELLRICERLITVNTDAVFKSTSFLECDKQAMEHILKMNLLSCSETEVFEACMSWVRAKSSTDMPTRRMVKTYLGDLFYEIRFASMTMPEFATLANSYGSVLSNDFENIAKMIVLPEFKPNKFNKEPRHIKLNKDAIIRCDRESTCDYEFKIDLISEENTTFSTNQPLLLGSFICSKFVDLESNLSVEVEICEAPIEYNPYIFLKKNAKTLICFRTSVQSIDPEILLPKSILIRPGFYYRISMKGFPESYQFISRKLLTKVQIVPDMNIQFYNDCIPDGQAVGLISTLNFNRI